jgi:hypothetical protein
VGTVVAVGIDRSVRFEQPGRKRDNVMSSENAKRIIVGIFQ